MLNKVGLSEDHMKNSTQSASSQPVIADFFKKISEDKLVKNEDM